MDDIYKNVENCDLNEKRKILIVFDNMIANMHSNKKLNNNHLLEEKNIYISFFITQSCFVVPKNMRLSSTHHFLL